MAAFSVAISAFSSFALHGSFRWLRTVAMAGVPAASGFAPAATGHQLGSPAATCHQPGEGSSTEPSVPGLGAPAATGQQPAAEAVHAAAASAAECPARARAIAAARDALAELAARTYVPQLIRDLGGYNAPVIVQNLVVADVFPGSLRHTVPSSRRVQEELHALVRALPGERARLIVKMSYWPKLLETGLVLEKKEEQAERTRLRGQAAREELKRRRLQEASAGGGHEPGDDADGSRPVVAPSPAVGGNELELKKQEMKRLKRFSLDAAATAGLSSASCAAADVEPGCGASSASCAASADDE